MMSRTSQGVALRRVPRGVSKMDRADFCLMGRKPVDKMSVEHWCQPYRLGLDAYWESLCHYPDGMFVEA